MVINHYNGDIMTSSLTLPGSGFHLPRRKHSLHDVLDWDRPEPPQQSDTLQRRVDVVKRTGIHTINKNIEPNFSHLHVITIIEISFHRGKRRRY